MVFLVFLASSLPSILATGSSLGPCQFSQDCQAHTQCQDIADASCVCNFGQCIISGNPFFRGSECEEYTDCACKANPASCFCRGGFCQDRAWECHQAEDCRKMEKCKGKNCACSGNLCEYECGADADCKEHHCNKALGYTCRCEQSLCSYARKPTECSTIQDCVAKGLCSSDTPCACTQQYCTTPWWVGDRDQATNCRTGQVRLPQHYRVFILACRIVRTA